MMPTTTVMVVIVVMSHDGDGGGGDDDDDDAGGVVVRWWCDGHFSVMIITQNNTRLNIVHDVSHADNDDVTRVIMVSSPRRSTRP